MDRHPTVAEQFNILTITSALGLAILAFVLGVSVLVYGAVLVARELSEWLVSF